MEKETLGPKDHNEAVAIFRSEIVGALCRRDLVRGELKEALRSLSQQRFRPPGREHTCTFSVPTLERWYYACKRSGLQALKPKRRKDRGRAKALLAPQRDLLLDIRREYPSASVPLILRTLILDGRLDKSALSPATLRRFYVEAGLDRVATRDGSGPTTRLRWQAEQPGALWHGDVCHGPAILVGDKRMPLRIHGMLDDASRYVVALEAHHQEREIDMMSVFLRALRRHGSPDCLYLDNGSTYRGDILRTACARMDISLLHAKPYDPQARGKMERFWRTLRENCLDYLGAVSSLHDVNVRLLAFLDQHYHQAPHASLMGQSPASVFAKATRKADDLDEKKIKDALTVSVRRRVRRDTTVSLNGEEFEIELGFLAGRVVTLGYSLAEPLSAPWLEHQGKRLALRPVDAKKNAHRLRPPRKEHPEPSSGVARHVPFDPPKALLDRASGTTHNDFDEEPF
jgi:transposase InsO family protein